MASPKRYLLVPAKPAPNGRLHVGHVSGPYLAVDMLARHLRRRGDQADIVIGTDSYDSFILMVAERRGIAPEALARESHAGIEADLRALSIEVAAFIDPLSSEWSGRYAAAHRRLLDDLVAVGAAEVRSPELPFSKHRGAPVLGCWLQGRCPDCGEGVAGYFCESCGAHFDGGEVVEPRARWGEGLGDKRAHADLFLRIDRPEELIRSLGEAGVRDFYVQTCKRYLGRNSSPRLTIPPGFGVEYDLRGEGRRTAFGHGLLYAYCRLLGDVDRDLRGADVNAFDADSGVTTVNAFGIDNVVSHMVGIQAAAAALPGCKGFDRFIVNRFLLLEGEKFSTSRGHLVWAWDLVGTGLVDADALRWRLAVNSPVETTVDFRIDDLAEFYNRRYVGDLGRRLGTLGQPAPAYAGAPSERMLRAFDDAMTRQSAGFEFETFDPRVVAAAIDRWIDQWNDPQAEFARREPHTWLKGLAVLAYPVLPRISGALWTALGYSGTPLLDAFAQAPQVPASPLRGLPLRPLAPGALNGCLPETMSKSKVPVASGGAK